MSDAVSRPAEDDTWVNDSDEFIAALGGASVRTYHCTRLTDREVGWIETQGLRLLTPELVAARIEAALTDGHLTPDQAGMLSVSHVAGASNRSDRVCLVGDRVTLKDAHAVGWLLSTWGGEGIYMAFESRSPETGWLGAIGTPAVVVALLDPARDGYRGHPGLFGAAITRQRGRNRGADIHCHVPLPADRIVRIEFPGSAFWTRYVWLPK